MWVAEDFAPPEPPATARFVLTPMGPEHNERDHAAWMSSIEHIRATPGFEERSWPHPMSLEENLADLEAHARDFRERTGFTYSVLDPVDGDVVGCVYIYPGEDSDAHVRSWVRASHAALDAPLWRTVAAWLADEWPFRSVTYAPR